MLPNPITSGWGLQAFSPQHPQHPPCGSSCYLLLAFIYRFTTYVCIPQTLCCLIVHVFELHINRIIFSVFCNLLCLLNIMPLSFILVDACGYCWSSVAAVWFSVVSLCQHGLRLALMGIWIISNSCHYAQCCSENSYCTHLWDDV